MYKVFFNEHQLVFGSEIDNSFKDNISQMFEIEEFIEIETILAKLEKSKHVVKLIVVSKLGENSMDLLRESMIQIPAAGGILRNEKGQLLFIKRMGKWDLPKGKVESNETIEQAAAREVEEECGISGFKILKKLPDTYHIYRSPFIKKGSNWVLKKTSWFEMSYSGNEVLIPQVEEQIEEVRWVKQEEIETVYENTYANMRQLIQSYLD